jgi:pyruvate,water dikinase
VTSLQREDASVRSSYVTATADCTPERTADVGGKAVGLGHLIRAGHRVPLSFVVTSSGYRRFASAVSGGFPTDLREEIEAAYATLSGSGTVPVAVRSSATVEDSTEASCAGQFRTFLGATGTDEVLEGVAGCFTSALDPRVNSYTTQRGLADSGAVAVIVQQLVDARLSGVMFTRHPTNGDPSLVVIESTYGLGEAVVGGEVTPDLIEVNKVTGEVQSRLVGSKSMEHRLAGDHRSVERRAVDDSRRSAFSIGDEEIGSLLEMATDLEAKLGRGLDIEWAIGSIAGVDGPAELFALQVRPITATARNETAVRPGHAVDRNPIDAVLGRLSRRHERENGDGS